MIGILLIATNKYKRFLPELVDSIAKYVTIDCRVHIFVDLIPSRLNPDVEVVYHGIESIGFPEATLYRYRIFDSHKDAFTEDYLLYMDVDMLIVDYIGQDIISENLLAVRHPGFWKGGGSWETRPESSFYVPEEKRKKYFCGGVQGGQRDAYLEASKILADKIDYDLQRGIMPVWHDESAWNWLLAHNAMRKELTPAYCYPDNPNQARRWGLGDISPKILALTKNHSEIRNVE